MLKKAESSKQKENDKEGKNGSFPVLEKWEKKIQIKW